MQSPKEWILEALTLTKELEARAIPEVQLDPYYMDQAAMIRQALEEALKGL